MVECVVDVGFLGEKKKNLSFFFLLTCLLIYLFIYFIVVVDIMMFMLLDRTILDLDFLKKVSFFEHTLRNVASNHANQNSITEKRFPQCRF